MRCCAAPAWSARHVMSREKRAEAEGVSTQGSQALVRRTWRVGAARERGKV